MLVLALYAALVAVPFEDTQHRFSVNLPAGWTFAPQPGDTGGAAFTRVADNIIGHAMIRVLPFNQPVELGALVAQIGASYSQEPGFRLLISEPATVANNPGQRRRFVTWINGDSKLPKISEQRVTIVNNVGYVLHVEAMAEAFDVFNADFERIFSSFVPGNGLPPAPVLPPPHKAHGPGIVGHWETAGGAHAVELSPSGIVILDGAHGHYRIEEGMLIVKPENGAQAMYEFSLEGTQLRLTGANFSHGQTFHRVVKKTKKIAPPAKAVEPGLATP